MASFREILLWVVVIAAAVMVLFGGIMVMKKWVSAPDEHAGDALPFTLNELRQMHAAGRLSDEEFERAKQQMVSAARRGIDPDAPQIDTSPVFVDEADDAPADNETDDGPESGPDHGPNDQGDPADDPADDAPDEPDRT